MPVMLTHTVFVVVLFYFLGFFFCSNPPWELIKYSWAELKWAENSYMQTTQWLHLCVHTLKPFEISWYFNRMFCVSTQSMCYRFGCTFWMFSSWGQAICFTDNSENEILYIYFFRLYHIPNKTIILMLQIFLWWIAV